jgi:hypothetical protein
MSQQQMLAQFIDNYLAGRGWLISADKKESVDQHGPVPWLTYPAIRMLERIATPRMRVFEYGAGNSSLWWGQRVQQVYTVEHDSDWYSGIRSRLGSANRVVYVPRGAALDPKLESVISQFFGAGLDQPPVQSGGDEPPPDNRSEQFTAYAAEMLRFPPGYFDIVVVDGRARVLSTWVAIRQLGPDGLLVLDDSNRERYETAYRLLDEAGFSRIDFWGPGPINTYEWCTSFFTKSLDLFRR